MATARFMAEAFPILCKLAAFDIEVDDDVPGYHEAEAASVIATSMSDDKDCPDWFSLSMHVHVGQGEIPLALLMAAVAAGEPGVLLESDTWVSIDCPGIETLTRLMEGGRELADSQTQGELRAGALYIDYYEILGSLDAIERATTRRRGRTGRLLERACAAEVTGKPSGGRSVEDSDAGDISGRTGEGPDGAPMSEGMRVTLCPYQLEGYRQPDLPRQADLSGVLADDTRLGKTTQVLAVAQRPIEQRKEAGADSRNAPQNGTGGQADGSADEPTGSDDPGELEGTGPVLVIVPIPVIGSWVEQVEHFCPGLRTRAMRWTAARREETLAQIMEGCDVVVTSYTAACLYEEELITQDRVQVVCNETQFVKNHVSVTYKAAWRLRLPSTTIIAGTPLENSLTDLQALMSIAAPGLLPDPGRFGRAYRGPIGCGDAEALGRPRRRMRPFLLRRTKEQVVTDLPAKAKQVLAVESGTKHRKACDQCSAREQQRVLGLLEEDTTQLHLTTFKALATLWQMALDPTPVDDEDGMEPETAESAGGGEAGGTGEAADETDGPGRKTACRKGVKGRDTGALVTSHSGLGRWPNPSAKVEVLIERLGLTLSEGHRALIFPQFTRYLSGIREHLETTGVRAAYMDGSAPDRQRVVDTFRVGEADAFLTSLKAGSFGLTLTEADYVFPLGPRWGPQTEEQAIGHTHRTGRDKPVMIYQLVSVDTIEEKIMALKEEKTELFAWVAEGAGEAETDGEGAGTTGDAAAAAGSGGLSPAALIAAEIRGLIEG